MLMFLKSSTEKRQNTDKLETFLNTTITFEDSLIWIIPPTEAKIAT